MDESTVDLGGVKGFVLFVFVVKYQLFDVHYKEQALTGLLVSVSFPKIRMTIQYIIQ